MGIWISSGSDSNKDSKLIAWWMIQWPLRVKEGFNTSFLK